MGGRMMRRRPRIDKTKMKMRPRKRSRFLEGIKHIDIHDVEFLRRFLTEHGKVLPARLTGASSKQQRQIRQGICRARLMGLLP